MKKAKTHYQLGSSTNESSPTSYTLLQTQSSRTGQDHLTEVKDGIQQMRLSEMSINGMSGLVVRGLTTIGISWRVDLLANSGCLLYQISGLSSTGMEMILLNDIRSRK